MSRPSIALSLIAGVQRVRKVDLQSVQEIPLIARLQEVVSHLSAVTPSCSLTTLMYAKMMATISSTCSMPGQHADTCQEWSSALTAQSHNNYVWHWKRVCPCQTPESRQHLAGPHLVIMLDSLSTLAHASSGNDKVRLLLCKIGNRLK